MKFEIALNTTIPGNYVFFDPITGIHLSKVMPVGYPTRMSPSILRGLRGKTIIDTRGVVDLKTGEFKVQEEVKEETKVEDKKESVKEEAPKEQPKSKSSKTAKTDKNKDVPDTNSDNTEKK